ncbi:AAA family ATPase [Methylovulum psychrotolerans]|uniref:Chromosome segregation protein SMC n=1 Tax=Methylovulum psychrotolerans TaxID=1704499 RepID=A0A1Z4C000_9GAMM|nr:ATP-binding protein [Methylovulum psychrotolerans]ASF46842.1 chromosome segregation protein SMC [Methylovulum psychrotolerans]
MIRQLHINNYKSLFDLTLEVGRFNVLIGENGCGKSNILEAIALAGAASADKLDNEFLVSRGIRVTDPQLMRSAFNEESERKPIGIHIDFQELDILARYILTNDNQPYSKWTWLEFELASLWFAINEQKQKLILFTNGIKEETHTTIPINEIQDELAASEKRVLDIATRAFCTTIDGAKKDLDHQIYTKSGENKLKTFLIYSPENTALRNFAKEGQIEPLGINGEGLLKLLKVIQSKSPEQREEIHATLQLFDWYDNIGIPKDLASIEDKVTLTDRYLSREFDQRSANEGFLFVLFYIALMVSDDTPKIFAIDNIDVALNPKLCTQLIKELVRLAKQYDKQVFVTTHNPAILDGIDLGDDEQRLLVVSRNKQGHTRVKRITVDDKPRSSGNEDLKLSEAFLRGYLGGLPKGF